MAAAAAALIPLLLLLPYVSGAGLLGGGSASGWETLHGSDVLLTLISIGVVVMLALDVFMSPSRTLTLGAAALACIAVGLAWPDLIGLPVDWSAGAYLVLLAAITSAAGAVLALSELGPDTSADQSPAPPAASGAPPAIP